MVAQSVDGIRRQTTSGRETECARNPSVHYPSTTAYAGFLSSSIARLTCCASKTMRCGPCSLGFLICTLFLGHVFCDVLVAIFYSKSLVNQPYFCCCCWSRYVIQQQPDQVYWRVFRLRYRFRTHDHDAVAAESVLCLGCQRQNPPSLPQGALRSSLSSRSSHLVCVYGCAPFSSFGACEHLIHVKKTKSSVDAQCLWSPSHSGLPYSPTERTVWLGRKVMSSKISPDNRSRRLSTCRVWSAPPFPSSTLHPSGAS